MPPQSRHQNDPSRHAIVIGGSVAGLLTARVLTDHFDHVTIIERDQLPETPTFRKGAPQARHTHVLFARGQHIMESLFPGFREAMLRHGAVEFNMGSEMAFFMRDRRMKAFTSSINALAASRALIEFVLRSQLASNLRLTLRQGQAVADLLTDDSRRRVTGVRVRDRSHPQAEPELIHASLVVDASGRGSRLPHWLERLGYTPPAEVTVDAKAGYASRIYRQPQDGRAWKGIFYLAEAPMHSRGGTIAPIEGTEGEARWIVTLVGLNGDHPPTDEAGFLEFAKSVPTPEFYQAIARAAPLSDPYGYRRAANRLRRYDELPRYLEGLFALGDSVYALNPVYGQGMTVAALGALTLRDVLDAHGNLDDLGGAARKFQRKLAKVIDAPWQLATGQDLRWPVAAEGHRPPLPTRLMQRYFDAVLRALLDDEVVAERFLHVQNMLEPPTTLFRPTILRRVWQHHRRQPRDDRAQHGIPLEPHRENERVG